MVAQATDSSFNLPWYSKIRPSKSLWDLDGLCCVSRQFVFWDTNIDPCLWCGTWTKEGERRSRKNSSPLSVTGLLWCLLEKKNLWQVNFLCSLLDSTTPDQDCPDLNFPTLKHLLSSYNHGKAVVQAGRTMSIRHIVPFPFKYIRSFFYHFFDLLFTQKNLF